MAKKILNNAAMNFISAAEDPAEVQQEGQAIPAGFKLVKESKTARAQLLIRPTTKEALQQIAEEEGTSFNNLINDILDDYVEERGRNGRN